MIKQFVNNKIGKSKIVKLEGDASTRDYYRIFNNDKTFILMDTKEEKKQFKNFLAITDILKFANITTPNIFFHDNNHRLIILEDFGNNGFDKLIHNRKYTNRLLKIAVQSIIELQNSAIRKENNIMLTYNYNIFKKDISEFIDWYYPFVWKKKISKLDKKNFYDTWKKIYKKINLKSNSFVHKDFFCNNLIYLPLRKNHLKCGIIDFQDAIWADNAFDIVSLFEDSRRIIETNIKDDLIDYYLLKTNQIQYRDDFFIKYNFIGASRQTKILGKWIKLYKIFNKPKYLDYINCTWYWLERNLNNSYLEELKTIYAALVPAIKRKYDH